MVKVINIKEYPEGLDKAINYYHSKWGNETNYRFFHDAMVNSSNKDKGLPRFYLLLKEKRIIGCCGLVTNDFISRHDLLPWLAGLFIEENQRGNSYGNYLMEFAEKEVRRIGYSSIYVTTDHDGYYEKYGWLRIEDGYELNGNLTRIYTKQL